MAKMFRRIFIIVAIFSAIFAFSQSASATLSELIPTPRPPAVPESFSSVKNVVTLVFNTIITISGIVFLIMLLIGGIQYLTGAGNEETTGKAKKMMIDAIVGLIIVLASWAIGVWILGQLGGAPTATPARPTSPPSSTPTSTPPATTPGSTSSETPSSPEILFQNTYQNPTPDDVFVEPTARCNAVDGQISYKTDASQTTIICTKK